MGSRTHAFDAQFIGASRARGRTATPAVDARTASRK
jgi:hypothetical protein